MKIEYCFVWSLPNTLSKRDLRDESSINLILAATCIEANLSRPWTHISSYFRILWCKSMSGETISTWWHIWKKTTSYLVRVRQCRKTVDQAVVLGNALVSGIAVNRLPLNMNGWAIGMKLCSMAAVKTTESINPKSLWSQHEPSSRNITSYASRVKTSPVSSSYLWYWWSWAPRSR